MKLRTWKEAAESDGVPMTERAQAHSLTCPFCKATLPGSEHYSRPEDWDFCPECRGRFSFSKPTERAQAPKPTDGGGDALD
jgi:hypothetical protein